MATPLTALGLMSGTSMDGIDVALVRSDGESFVERGEGIFVPYEALFRDRLAAALDTAKGIRKREERPGMLAPLEQEITQRHAAAVESFCQQSGISSSEIELIGFHGQTVLHRPEKALTVQLGDGVLLARLTGVDVVADMRANDMAHGGQGAPLVPAYHAALAASFLDKGAECVAFVNIGGIANVTFVSPDGPPLAFDCGPGNALIDQWVQEKAGIGFDQDGRIASEGGIVEIVLEQYLADPFFSKPGPKSLDRNDFTLAPLAGCELHDGAATLAKLTAQTIADTTKLAGIRPTRWIVAGGGARNAAIMHFLRDAAGAPVQTAGECGLSEELMEAEAWAYLAIRSAAGLPLTWPTTTGVSHPVSGGLLHKPEPISSPGPR